MARYLVGATGSGLVWEHTDHEPRRVFFERSWGEGFKVYRGHDEFCNPRLVVVTPVGSVSVAYRRTVRNTTCDECVQDWVKLVRDDR